MALNKSLNATCNLNGYLFCRMPAEALEVEIKVKTKWGKFSMFQDTYTRTEKYHAWERSDRRSSVRARRRGTPHREARSSHEEDNTTSEADVPGRPRTQVSPSGVHWPSICSRCTSYGRRRRTIREQLILR